MPISNGPFTRPLDGIAQEYQKIHQKTLDNDKTKETLESDKQLTKERLDESAQNRFFTQLAAKVAYGDKGTKNLNAGKCPQCGGEATTFTDEISRREHEISGLCQSCQNKSFKEENSPLNVATPTAEEIAKKHNLSVEKVKKLVTIGAEVEKEHTTTEKTAEEIARDHLGERPDYYDKLKKAENSPVNEAGSIKTDWTDKKRLTPGELKSYAQQDDRAFDRNFPGVRQPDSDWDEEARKRRTKKRKYDPNYDTTKERDMDLKDETINEVSFDKLEKYSDKARDFFKTYGKEAPKTDMGIYGDNKGEQAQGAAYEKWIERGRQNRKKGLMTAYLKMKARARVPGSYTEENINEAKRDVGGVFSLKGGYWGWSHPEIGGNTTFRSKKEATADYEKNAAEWKHAGKSYAEKLHNLYGYNLSYRKTKSGKFIPQNEETITETWKVGDEVVPNLGPHKGHPHKIIHVFDNGEVNIQPLNLRPKNIRYHLGAARATPDQIKPWVKNIDVGGKLSFMGKEASVGVHIDRTRKEETVNEHERRLGMRGDKKDALVAKELAAGRPIGATWPNYDEKHPKPGVTIRSTTVPKEKVAEYGKDVVKKGIAAGKLLKKMQQDYYTQRKAKIKRNPYEETINEARRHFGVDYGDDDYEGGNIDFADPGGRSALRAATKDNPRIYACPSCHSPNRLTKKDVQLGYQCDTCADKAERGLGPED